MSKMLRLDKYLADAGIGTRSQVKQLIRKGKVSIDGIIEKKPERKIDVIQSAVICDEQPVVYQKYKYILLHKPAGYVSATQDNWDETVLSLLPPQTAKGLFPVGRLDKDTEGLLLLTNDGDLAHRLLSPKRHVDKTYYAKVQGLVTLEDGTAFLGGIDIGDEKPTLPAKLEILNASEESEIMITIQEGRFHQVKRMFEARNKKVIYLKRVSMGPLTLDKELLPGQFRDLTNEELLSLERIKEC
ncbi:MAG: rRNA pseudouridine synthase [Clostridia bacterium]|nr:rRNA pseudouridine synthase [Clostridia bacterium]NCC44523.1 rRNA pseudouridine synthase [Clostridia bacterium]